MRALKFWREPIVETPWSDGSLSLAVAVAFVVAARARAIGCVSVCERGLAATTAQNDSAPYICSRMLSHQHEMSYWGAEGNAGSCARA